MARSRVLSCLAVLAVALAAPAPAAAATPGSGGVRAGPLRQGPGGGSVAPEGSDSGATVPSSQAPPPVAMPSQAPTPTPPGGDEQSGSGEGQEPVLGEEVLVPEGDGRTGGAESSADGEAQASARAIDFLPLTGLALAALAATGVALLAAGLALRPRRRTTAEPR
jgi:hypothetical protein